VTHSWDMSRRYVPLDFVADGDRLLLQAPAHGALAPPGWYMLFLVDHAGVPSVARMMALG
jgi:NADPH-dependent ferric siderophore reductase